MRSGCVVVHVGASTDLVVGYAGAFAFSVSKKCVDTSLALQDAFGDLSFPFKLIETLILLLYHGSTWIQ